jgi:plastocyanin
VHFHFLHRFDVAETPDAKVSNSPTFLTAVALPHRLLAGARYASSSVLVNAEPNEWEAFARWGVLRQERGAPLDAGVEVAWNTTAGSVDGELTLARGLGPIRLIAAGRAFSAYADSTRRFALAGGAVARLHRFVALAGDVALPLDRGDGEDVAWSAGLHLTVPYTPHSLSLHLSNVNTTTLQGSTVGRGDARWGFEFTVPLTLSRFATGFAGGGAGAAASSLAAPVPTHAPSAGGDTVFVDMGNTLRFAPETVRVRVGQTVVWRNTSDIMHTVTADPARAQVAASVRLPAGAPPFDSGALEPGAAFAHRFTVAGEYRYFCIPHERAGMTGAVVVTP